MSLQTYGAALALLLCAAPAAAQDATPDDGAAKAFLESLTFKSGETTIGAAKARLALGPDFRFLEAADARRVLEDFWSNPPDESVLGMIVPTTPSLDHEDSWAVVVTYSDEGYVSDEDAAKIDYNEMMAEMKEGSAEENEARQEAGYGTVDLIGWAEPPRYDAAAKKLYWAKELAFDGAGDHTVNYDIRVLGRHGYLSLNAVAQLDDLSAVRSGMQELLPMVEFDAGARYADYNAETDKLAAYGVAALIGGGLAAKTGLFAKLGLLLVKFWKLAAIGVFAVGAILGKLFKKKEPSAG